MMRPLESALASRRGVQVDGHILTVVALQSRKEISPDDDLVEELLEAANRAVGQLHDGDVICVASKVVAITEGAFLDAPDETDGNDTEWPTSRPGSDPAPLPGDPAVVRRLARRGALEVVADSPWVLITRTRHGFVAANNAIDRSNVPGEGWLDLPRDPDASARALRSEIFSRRGVDVAVIITDTFGRPWRMGQTDVALGIAGTAALRDERGGVDLQGRTLEVTMSAVADELAGAADLVRSKSSATPFVLVRGHTMTTPHGSGQDLIRRPEEDLFRRGGADAVIDGVMRRRTVRVFDRARPVPTALLEEAVRCAATAPAPHHTRPWRFVRVNGRARETLLAAMHQQWRADLEGDDLDPARLERRLERARVLHASAPELLAAFVDVAGAHDYPDGRRRRAERDLFLLAGGAGVEAALIALAARGLGAAWTSSTTFCPDTVRRQLRLPDSWEPLGTIAIGYPVAPVEPRPDLDVSELLLDR